MGSDGKKPLVLGQQLVVTIEKVAHGGHFIARHDGAVIFVRHAIPGEEVRIEITSTGSSFLRADVIEVISQSPDRVQAPCDFAFAGGCGGCDFQHIEIKRQRELKSEVITEQFARIAKKELVIEVEEIGAPLGWRSRVTASTNRDGKFGFIASRSHSVIPVTDCKIAAPELNITELATRTWKGDMRIEVASSSTGERVIAEIPTRAEGPAKIIEGKEILHEEVLGHTLEVSQASFWQSHRKAPDVLAAVVKKYADVKSGDHVLDLYGGVGLFTAVLIDEVGAGGRIDLVEGSKSATSDATKNFADNTNVHIFTGDVAKVLQKIKRADVVVLDPPREGAGKEVVALLQEISPRRIVYVACDPAALARDTTYLEASGYQMREACAFDLFPMTHHIETIALYERNEIS